MAPTATDPSVLLEVLRSRGCKPLAQCGVHELRDAVHEAAHVLQSGARSFDRERINNALSRKACNDHRVLLRLELQARGVELLACKRFGIPYDIDNWAFIMWRETLSSLRINIGSIEDVSEAIRIMSRQITTKMLLDRVLEMRPRRVRARGES